MVKLLNKCIAGLTGTIALALGAIAAFWTDSDYQQYSAMAHTTAYALLWTLWLLTLFKFGFGIKPQEKS